MAVNHPQLQKFRAQDWTVLQIELLRYSERKAKAKRWKTAHGLPKGLEPGDIVTIAIAKTLNAIIGEDDEPRTGMRTWNEDVHPSLVDHLKSAIDSELSNLVQSEEHRSTNYSANVSQGDAQEILDASVDRSGSSDAAPASIELEQFELFSAELLKALGSDKDATDLFLAYRKLANTNDVVKPQDAAKMLNVPIKEIYNTLKRVARAANSVKKSMESRDDKKD